MQNYSNETIVSSIAESLGLNPLITPHYKRVMKLMLAVKGLRNISEEKIDTIGILSDICKKVEFYDLQKRSWIPSRELTKHELERILFDYERILKLEAYSGVVNNDPYHLVTDHPPEKHRKTRPIVYL